MWADFGRNRSNIQKYCPEIARLVEPDPVWQTQAELPNVTILEELCNEKVKEQLNLPRVRNLHPKCMLWHIYPRSGKGKESRRVEEWVAVHHTPGPCYIRRQHWLPAASQALENIQTAAGRQREISPKFDQNCTSSPRHRPTHLPRPTLGAQAMRV